MQPMSAKLSHRLGRAVQAADLAERITIWNAMSERSGVVSFDVLSQMPEYVQSLVHELEARLGLPAPEESAA